MKIKEIESSEKKVIKEVVKIHMETFDGFFLTFLGKGFLNCLYNCYCKYKESGLIVALENDEPIGFLAYSGDYSGLFKYIIKKKILSFIWYSLGAFIRKPKIFLRLCRAFLKSDDVKRKEKYIELASIGVLPNFKSKGIGTALILYLKTHVYSKEYSYISLETDADNNEMANNFYKKNGFVLVRTYKSREGRNMNEYRFSLVYQKV